MENTLLCFSHVLISEKFWFLGFFVETQWFYQYFSLGPLDFMVFLGKHNGFINCSFCLDSSSRTASLRIASHRIAIDTLSVCPSKTQWFY